MAKAKEEKQTNKEETKSIVSDQFHGARRIQKNDIKFWIDTFKLDVATFKKNIAPLQEGQAPNYVNFEHCHIYHTKTEKGKPNTTCAPVGGHYHDVYIEINENGDFVGRTSEPLQNRGSEMIAPIRDSRGKVIDNHTHEVIYLKSDEQQMKQINPELIKLQNELYKPVTTPSDKYVERN